MISLRDEVTYDHDHGRIHLNKLGKDINVKTPDKIIEDKLAALCIEYEDDVHGALMEAIRIIRSNKRKFLFCSNPYYDKTADRGKYSITRGCTYEVISEDDDFMVIRDNFNKAFTFIKHDEVEGQTFPENPNPPPLVTDFLREFKPRELKGTVWDD